ncbi:hypothetical protein VNO78_20586 [Psophocarpus tetragonolobus]|uniref:Uncharacterized protein n=1 Tax=Psophocarpus tetragonolobus TaxID=3891 RepID=A0AAN9SA74_PSOTE
MVRGTNSMIEKEEIQKSLKMQHKNVVSESDTYSVTGPLACFDYGLDVYIWKKSVRVINGSSTITLNAPESRFPEEDTMM